MRWLKIVAIVGVSGLVLWMLPSLQARPTPTKKVQPRNRTQANAARPTQARKAKVRSRGPKIPTVRKPRTNKPIPIIRLKKVAKRSKAPKQRGAVPRRLIECTMILLISGMT